MFPRHPFCACAFALILFTFETARAQPAPSPSDNIKRLEEVTGIKLDAKKREAERNASLKVRARLNTQRRELLAAPPEQFVGGKPTFSVGYNKVLELKDRHLSGAVIPPDYETRFPEHVARTQSLKEREERFQSTLKSRGLISENDNENEADGRGNPTATCDPTASAFNWRDVGKVSPVVDQRQCGSCWAFAAAAALESGYLIHNNRSIKVSEQHLVSCSRAGTCDGGWYFTALEKLMGFGAADGTAYPYVGNNAVCELRKATPYHWSNWGHVNKTPNKIPPPEDIKQALCKHGPVMTALQTTRNFHQYIGGVLNEVMPRPGISHAVVIVGWDDAKQAWLIKNSWGTTRWGPYGGYAWVHYKAHNIGTATVWVEPSKEYKLKDSCEPFDAVSARVRRISVPVGPEQEKDVWAIVDGETVVRTFGDAAPQSQNADDLTEDPNEDDARTALTMMRHYKIDRECNVSQSSDDAPFRYWLVGNKAPSGRHPDEDCVDIEWQRLDVTKEGDDWLLSDGTSLLEVFPGDRFNKTEEAAWLAYGYLKKHKMTRMCYFSRRDTTLRYYRQ